jgi:hypothetical protein
VDGHEGHHTGNNDQSAEEHPPQAPKAEPIHSASILLGAAASPSKAVRADALSLAPPLEPGSENDIGPGQAYVIEPGHDAWVVGNEPVVGFEFDSRTAEEFAKGSSARELAQPQKGGSGRARPRRVLAPSRPGVSG